MLGGRGDVRKVRILLDQLKPDHEVLHDLRLHQGHVDHVVIGASGVYAVAPRAFRGRVRLRGGKLTCNGLSAERSRSLALDQATYVRRQLAASGVDAFVTAAIAVTSGHMPDGVIDLRDLLVVQADLLPSIIRRRRFRLDVSKVRMTADELRHLAG